MTDALGSSGQGRSEDEKNAVFGEYGAFTKSIQESGNMVAGDALQPTSTATIVRVRDGETLRTPFSPPFPTSTHH